MRRDVASLALGEHDLLIVGGGIYGVTAAYEAARRGLRVALVEAEDFGAGVSWNSLKTIHGGLRHLQRLDLQSHRESVRERRALLRLAPELVRPMPFLVPAHGHGARGREALVVGLLLNDLLSLDRNAGLGDAQRLPRGRWLSRAEALTRVPGLPAEGLVGAALWHDAQVSSSERLLVGFLRAAVDSGARVANHCEAVTLLRGGPRVVGARVRDREAGAEAEIRARIVLNAAGPGADRLLADLAGRPRPGPLLMAMNLVFEGPSPLRERLGVGARSGGRFLFLVPWQDRLLAGTEYPEEPAGPEAIARFRAELAQAFPWAGLAARRLLLVHRGLVPGAGGPEGLATRPRFIDHEAEGGSAGLLTVQGVKYTTARAVAERAVALASAKLGRRADRPVSEDPLPWARPLEGTLAERTRAAIRDEMARTLTDAVLRRLDLGTGGPPPAPEIDEVTRVMADELGWDAPRASAERRALAAFYEAAYNGL